MVKTVRKCAGCNKACNEPEGIWAWKPPAGPKVFFCSSSCAEKHGFGHAGVEALPPQGIE